VPIGRPLGPQAPGERRGRAKKLAETKKVRTTPVANRDPNRADDPDASATPAPPPIEEHVTRVRH
jgi:hypothetical protein